MPIVYCRRDDGICGWCDTRPSKEQIDDLGTTYLACDPCFNKHGVHDTSKVAVAFNVLDDPSIWIW